jgi:hypothetical protein
VGYYTCYELEIVGGHYELLQNIIANDREMFYGLEMNVETYYSVKWYDHEQDMKQLSKELPAYVFKLSGNGEESGDLWVKYFKSGKVQKCEAKITFDDFDENKLR